MHSKSQISSIFTLFKAFVENQTTCNIKSIQIDNVKELLAVSPYLRKHGIRHMLTCAHTPEQNDSIECKHRQITDTGLSLRAGANLLRHFWG